MKCVVDTSAVSWLVRIGYESLLKEIYDGILAPQIVFDQLKPHHQTKEFVENDLEKIVSLEEDARKFEIILDKWQKWCGLRDRGDIEVFVAYCFFSDADEVLFANEGAINVFSVYGGVRDIVSLYRHAEQKSIFERNDTITYLKTLLNNNYRTKYIPRLIESLTS